MNRSRVIGKTLIICGTVLSVPGIIILFAKNNPIVSVMSLPVLFIGIIIWYNPKKNSPVKNDNRGSMISNADTWNF